MRNILLIVFLWLSMGCDLGDDHVYSPKPRMYPYIELPTPRYEEVTNKYDCGFSFKKSIYANILDRKSFFGEELINDCWFDLKYSDLNADIHFTYYTIGREHSFDTLIDESFRMVYEHSAVSSAIFEDPLFRDDQQQGMVFSLNGPVASPYQFYLTDSTTHFLRAALYFNSRPNPDSVAPVLDYIRTDMEILINSFEWH